MVQRLERRPEDTAAHVLPMLSLNLVPSLGGSIHDCACSLSSTSTPCAYSLTQSCLVSPGAWMTSSPLFRISLGSFFHSHMCEPSVYFFPLFFSIVRSLIQVRNRSWPYLCLILSTSYEFGQFKTGLFLQKKNLHC